MKRLLLSLTVLLTATAGFGQVLKATTVELRDSMKYGNTWVKQVPDVRLSLQQAANSSTIDGNNVYINDPVQGGPFIVRPKNAGYTVNMGTVFPMADTNWVLVRNMAMTNYFNVKWFGAKGDGTTDDWNAINNAINSLPDALGNGLYAGTVYFPPGNYRLSKPLKLQKAIHLLGESGFIDEASTLLFDNGIDGIIACAPVAADANHTIIKTAQGFAIDKLAVVQASGTKTIGHGLWMKTRGSVNESAFRGWAGDAIHLEANGTTSGFYDKVLLVDVAQPGAFSDTTAPTVTFTSATGTGAIAKAVLGGKVTAITVTYPGKRYIARPFVRVDMSDQLDRNTVKTKGWGAGGFAVLQLDSIAITNGGTGYTHATISLGGTNYVPGDAVIIDSSQLLLDSSENNVADTAQGSISGNISGGVITGATVLDSGEYRYAPTIIITGDGTGATAKAYMKIKRIVVTSSSGGSWFEPADTPVVHIFGGHEDGDFTAPDATAVVTSMGNWTLKRITVSASGQNYYTEPMVTISGSNMTSTATARALIGRDRQGNANQFILNKVRVSSSSNGLFVRGSDANAGTIVGIDASFNKQAGINEQSFLGNTYIGTHSTANVITPIYAIGSTASNLFLNSYTEGNQPPIMAIEPTRFMGGTLGARILQKTGIPAKRLDINGVSGKYAVNEEGTNYTRVLTLGGNVDNGNILSIAPSYLGATYSLVQKPATSDFEFLYQNDEANHGVFRITGESTKTTFGRDSAVANATAVQRLFLGQGHDFSKYRQVTYSDIFPPRYSDKQRGWAKGDFVLNSNPTASTGILGWLRLTTGVADVLGTDWLSITAGIQNQNTTLQAASFYTGSSNASYITNTTVAVNPLTIGTGGGLHLIGRAADGYQTVLSIYQNNATSGMHFASAASNNGIISAGGPYIQTSNGITGSYKALETSMTSYAQKSGKHYWLNGTGLTIGNNVSLNKLMTLDETGLSLTGSDPTAGLNLKQGTTTIAALKFTSGAVLATGQAGAWAYDGINYYAYPLTTRKRLPLQNDVTATNGQLLVGNGTDYSVASLGQDYGIINTVGSGTLSVGADTASANALVSKIRLKNTMDSIASAITGGTSNLPVTAKVATDQTTTASTTGDITGLSVSVGANKKYKVIVTLIVGCSGTGGISFGFSGPSGTALESGSILGTSSTSTTMAGTNLPAIGSATGLKFNTFATSTTKGFVQMTGFITTSTTSGSLTIQFASGTATQTSTVYAGSKMEITEDQ